MLLPRKDKRKIDVVPYGEVIQEIEFLEYESEPLSSEGRKSLIVYLVQAVALEDDLSFRRLIESRKVIEKSGLT